MPEKIDETAVSRYNYKTNVWMLFSADHISPALSPENKTFGMWIIREGKAIMSNIEISEAETRKLQRISLKW